MTTWARPQFNGVPVGYRGAHGPPCAYANEWVAQGDLWPQRMKEAGLDWVVLYSASDNALTTGAAERLLDWHIYPIVRFEHTLPDPFTYMAATEGLVALYGRYGLALMIAWLNEPGMPCEWRDQEVPRDWMQVFARRWMEGARLIAERGAIPLLADRPCWEVNPFELVRGCEDLFYTDQAGVAYHGYGLNRPPWYPGDSVSRTGLPELSEASLAAQLDEFAGDPVWNEPGVVPWMNELRRSWPPREGQTGTTDPTCWRGYELLQEYSRQAFGGHVVKMVMTEGGWTPRARAGSGPDTDIRYPYPTPLRVAQWTLFAFRELERLAAEGSAPLEGMCPWCFADSLMNGGHSAGWEADAWWSTAWLSHYPEWRMPVYDWLVRNPPVEATHVQ